MGNFENFRTPTPPPPPLKDILIIWLEKSVSRQKILNLSSLKPVAPNNTQKFVIDVFFPAEHDTGVSLPLLVQATAGNSKNRKIEEPS